MGKYDDLHAAESPSKYADLHEAAEAVWTRPQEGADPGDVGPPSDGLPLESKDPSLKRTVSVPEAIAAPFGEGVAGVPVAALAGAYDTATGKRESLLRAYQERRREQKYQAQLAREQRPWSSLAGGVADAVAEMSLAGAAVPSKAAAFMAKSGPAARAAYETMKQLPVFAGNDYARSGEGTTVGQATRRGAEDMLAGQLAGVMTEAVAQPVKNAGKGLQWPQRAAEWMAEKVGRTSAGKTVAGLGGEPKEIGDKYVSDRVRNLRQTADAGDIGQAAASQVDDSLRAVGSFADKKLANLTPGETKALAQEFDALLKVRGAQSSSPEKLLGNWDEFLRSYDLNPGKATAADVIRAVNKRDASHVATMGSGMQARNRALGIADTQIDSFKDMFGGSERARADFLAGKASRTGEGLAGGSAGTAQFRLSELEKTLSTPEDKLALRLANAAQRGEAEIGEEFQRVPKEFASDMAGMSQRNLDSAIARHAPGAAQYEDPMQAVAGAAEGRLGKSLADAERARVRGELTRDPQMAAKYFQIGKEATGETTRDMDALFARARELQDKLKQLATMAEDESLSAANRKRVEMLGAKAQAELDRITTGRAAIAKGLGIAGGVAAGSAGGILSGIGGAGAGASALRAADVLGAAGQRLAKGRSLAEKLAQEYPDAPIGKAAKWAMSSEGPARIEAFMADPYVREYLDKDQQSPR